MNRRETILTNPALFPGVRVAVRARAVVDNGATWRVATYVEADRSEGDVQHDNLNPEADATHVIIAATPRTGVWKHDAAMESYNRLVAAYEAGGWQVTESRRWHEERTSSVTRHLKGASMVLHANGVAEAATVGTWLVDPKGHEWLVGEKDGAAVLHVVRNGVPSRAHFTMAEVEAEHGGMPLTVVDDGRDPADMSKLSEDDDAE